MHVGIELLEAGAAGQLTEVEVGGLAQVAGAAALAVVAVAGDPFGLAGQAAGGVGVVDALDAAEQVGQPARHGVGEADHLGQRAAGGRRRGLELGHDEVAEALGFAQGPGGVAILFAGEQQHVAVGAQHGLDGALPGGVGDLDDLGQRPVGDAGLAEAGAEAADLGVAGRAAVVAGGAQLGGFLFEGGDGLALLALQVQQADVGFGVFGLQIDGGVAGLAGQAGAQGAALGEELVEVAHVVVGGEVVFFGVEVALAGGVAGGLGGGLFGFDGCAALPEGGEFGLALRAVGAAAGDLAPGQRDVADELGHFEAGHDLAFEGQGFVVELLPFEVAVGLEALGFGLGAQAVEVEAEGGELALGVVLFFAGGGVVVEHLLVTEDVEDQLEERLGRVFAELVGVALLQRQHLGDGRGEAAPGEAGLVVAVADPLDGLVGVGFEGLDGDVAVGDGVVAGPVAAGAADAAGQRDLVLQARKERPLAGAARPVGDHRADPREAAVGAAHVAAEVALARAA